MADNNCTYKLKLKDNTSKEFNSLEELNSFVRDNKKELVSTLLKNQRFFSVEKNTPQQVESLLKARNEGMHLRKGDHTYFRTLEGGATEEGYTSTTQWISKKHNLGNPDKSEFMVPSFNKDEYLGELAGEMNKAGLNANYITNKLDELQKTWDISSIAGTSFHDIAENFVLKNYTNPEQIKADYPKLTDEQAKMYFDGLTTLIAEIKKEHGDDATLLPEFIIVDENKKITGTIDLLVIDNKGKLHIYDYKTSFKDISDWKQIKKNAIDYQLTTYKQILLRQDFEVGKTKYIPIKINNYNAETDTVENFQIEQTMDSTQSSRGDVTFKINLLLPYVFRPKSDFIVDNKAINEVLLKAFNYEVKNALTNKNAAQNTAKQQLDYMLTTSPRTKDYKNREFIYLPSIGGKANAGKRMYTADTEEKNLQLITAYLVQLQAYNTGLPTKITEYVDAARKAVDQGRDVDNGVLWGSEDPLTADYINNLFSKYINSNEWKAFESDAMNDLGIVAFENQNTQEVDFVSITGKPLRGENSAPALLEGRKKLLGNTLSDRESTDLGFYHNINNGDIELLKVYAFIQNNEATFGNKKIGSIAAVQLNSNQTIGSIATQTLSTIQSQWNGLVNHGDDFELKRKAWQVTGKDNYESLVAYVKEMFNEKGNKITINLNKSKVISNLKSLDKLVDVDHKLKMLGDILVGLEKDVKNKNRLASETNEKKELIFLVANSILQLQNINLSVQDDVKRFGSIVGDNLMVSIPEKIRDVLVKHAVNLTNTALNDARHKFNADSKDLVPMHTKFYEGINASDFTIKVIGNNYDYFKNLIQKDGERYTWVFKDPKTDSTLQKAEREYITAYLKHVNDIKRSKLVSLYGEGSDSVIQFDLNPPRDIPLMKASGYSALHNKGIKEYAKDYWATLENDTRVFENDKDYQDKINLQTQMFNQFDRFDTDPEARLEYLETHSDSKLELDLENVIFAYTMANAKQTVFDEALPTLNSLKAVAMLSNNFYFRNLDNVEGFIEQYIGTNLFGKKILAGENKTLAKGAQVLTGTLSKLTLGLSVPTFLNETFNNAFMSISKVFGASIGKKQFSKESWLSAETLVWADKMTKSQMNIGKMNFTRQLNAMFSIVESDLGQLQHHQQSTSTSLQRNFMSNVTMKLNQLPNFAHRMSFFVAQMIEDGVIKQSGGSFSKDSAMKLVGENLIYNPKLDGRFALYLNNPSTFPTGREGEWKESRARYLKVEAELKDEPNGIDETTGLITRPYENKTRDSLKSIADEIFGGYDPESKVMWAHTAMGQLFNQFKNWMWAKKHRIWSETDVNGRQGKWVYDKDQEEVIWKNDLMEGFGNSMWALFQQVKESRDLIGSWNELSPDRKERIMWGLSDLVLFALFAGLASFLIKEFNAKDYPVSNMFAKSMRNATSDLAFWSAIGTVVTPNNQIPMLGMINKTVQGTIGLVTDDHMATQQMLNSLGLYRTLNPVYKTLKDESE